MSHQLPHNIQLDPHQHRNSEILAGLVGAGSFGLDFTVCGGGKTWEIFAAIKKAGLLPTYTGVKSGIAHVRHVAKQFWPDYELPADTWSGSWRQGHEIPAGSGYCWFADEIQAAQSFKSNQGKFMAQHGSKGPWIGATGTPPDNPLKWANILHAAGVVKRSKFYDEFAPQYGCSRVRWGNRQWEFDGNPAHSSAIRELLAPNTVQTKASELEGYPENRIFCEPMDIDSPNQLNQFALALAKKRPSNLGETQQVRQAIEMLKVDGIVEMARDLMSQGVSVFVAVNFKDSLNAIADGIGTDLKIQGEVSEKRREAVINEFQASDVPQALVANSVAGGVSVSLHDDRGAVPRQSIICPNWSAQTFVQSLYRIHRRGSKSASVQRVVFANGTFETRVMDVLQNKITQLETILDTDLDIRYHTALEELAA